MALAPRRIAFLGIAAAGALVVVLLPSAAADTESAAAVIAGLQEQGFTVEINGVPSGDTSLLTNCTVTAIHRPGDSAPSPSPPDFATNTVYVDVACPIQRG